VSAVWSQRTGYVVSGRILSWSGKVRYPGGAVVKAVLDDDVLLVRRGRPLCHVLLHLVDKRRRRRHALTRPPSIDET
jgi:hypothetical protein